jgi:hypothetical protein
VRAPGELIPSPAVCAALAALRRRAGVSTPAELELPRVREIETAFAVTLPDDLLAVYASRVPELHRDCGMSLGAVVAHTGALRDAGAPGDLVGVGRDGRAFVCIAKRAPGSPLVSWEPEEPQRPFSLLAFLERRAAGAPPGPAELRVVVLPSQPESTLSGRRVRHKAFGEGRLLKEIGTGPDRKVQVDFPGRGLKLLQARFLEFLD